jgi:8-oxo-dGTP diphosphatase
MVIYKVGAIILNENKQMLVARKRVPGRTTFIIPGGKPEPGETDHDTCRRELSEELGVDTLSLRYFGRFEEPSEFEDALVNATVYTVEIKGTPRPNNEIVELAWVDGVSLAEGFDLGTILSKHVMPRLIQEGVLNSGGSDRY